MRSFWISGVFLETKPRSIYHSIWRETFHGIYTKKNGKSVGS
jgi:hypothetical protein